MTEEHQDGVEDSTQLVEVVLAVVRLLRETASGKSMPAESLSLTEFRLLNRVAKCPRLAIELASELDVTTATISAAVNGLVQRGLVHRGAPSGDRRAVPLSATDSGRKVLEAARMRQHHALAVLLSHLRPEERRALMTGISGLARIFAGNEPP